MRRVEFVAVLESPLVIGARRQARVPACLDHVPGSALRGVLLSSQRRLHGEDATFQRLLEPGRNRFPFLYPGPAGTAPVARSAMECKRASVEHGLVDVLIDRYLATRPGAGNTEFERLEKAHRCQTCGQPRKRASGYRFVRERLPAPVRVQRMNVGIDRRTGSAAPHVLFGSQSLDPWSPGKDGDWHQATFSGMGYLEDDDLEVFLQLCEGPVFLGKYRSRGFGRVNLSIEPADDGGGREPGIEEGFARLKDLTGEPEGEVFTIDVTSPLLAFDRFLRPTSRPDEWLPRSLQAEVLTNMPTRTTVSGWDLACGMPKDDHPAVGAGSTLLARSRLARTDLARELAGIERVGIGERPEEGFGQIMVNDPFRFETQE